ncbi:unnamed protein product [Clonostachys solani]|uniref:Zn(2)-C6 fungal-type domain-containing protein n=1 Tax=Clonostachys solani TaxID=160281 RepID=A0A9N9ZHC9_9HYPO|nr:unnamed protein product [Clonostachys solani]
MNTGTESESDRPVARFRPSCLQCQRLKKKCDRKRPQCSLCTRQNRTCLYDERSTYSDTVPSDSAPISDSRIEFSTQFRNEFPSVYFLDSVLFQRSGTKMQDAGSDLGATLSSLVGDISTNREFVALYFEFVHPWLPFLSKKRFLERVLNPLGTKQIGNMLLISSMKLVAENIVEDNTISPLYNSVKLALLRLEMAGNLDFRTLQAWIMVSLYELGHGIYPAAYLTIGTCVRYARALCIHLSVENSFQSSVHDELDREERRRSWWAILLLDHFVHLGCPAALGVNLQPTSDSILPIDDSIWDQGELSGAQLYRLYSPLTATMGRFCLTAQAAILLRKVFQHVNDTLNTDQFRHQEATALDNTIAALTQVSLEEGRFRGIGVCSPTTICFSARLLLHDEERRQRSGSLQRITGGSPPRHIVDEILASMLRLAQALASCGNCGAEQISPFCLEAMYRSGIIFAQRFASEGDEDAYESFKILKLGLEATSRRWKAGSKIISWISY